MRVPIILTPDVIAAINILIKTRSSVGVATNNRYIFAAPTRNSTNHLRGNDCMSSVVERVKGLEHPEAIHPVATVSQILNLESNEMDWLARLVVKNISL